MERGSSWTYLDTGAAPPGWTAPDFDDSAWAQGPAPLGYGDSQLTQLSYGESSASKHITAYFRAHFELGDPALSGTLSLLRDDGAVVFLNGQELLRSNMPSGEIDAQTLAAATVSGAGETSSEETAVPAELLLEGDNVLAVEVHQASPSSSDLSFDLGLEVQVLRAE